MSDAPDLVCPYPGLRPFTKAESHYYFGRDQQRNECIARLETHRFLAVVGSSGAGKSSLVQAGLLPEIELGRVRGTDENWRFVIMRPGADPMSALTRALAGPNAPLQGKLDELLRTSPRGLAAVAELLGEQDAQPHSLLLVVDQFEELFRLGKEQVTPQRWLKERIAFVRAITSARSLNAPVFVLLTMRSDFLKDCTKFPGLPEALNHGMYLVPQLSLEQLEHSLVRPLEQVTGIEARMSVPLVRRILRDAAGLPDELPVVQHALMRTWLEWRKRVPGGSQGGVPDSEIGIQDYEKAGTTMDAIDRHGNELLGALEQELGQDRARVLSKALFQRLTITDADATVTRSPKSLEHLIELASSRGIEDAAAGLRRVIEVFRHDSCRFLMPEDEVKGDVDIAHEAVFRQWAVLAGEKVADMRSGGWIAEEHENGRSYVRLLDADTLRKSKRGQLLTDELLTETAKWWDSFKPNPVWATRYHIPDRELERIQAGAKEKLDECERAEASGAKSSSARDDGYADYARKLQAWHQGQFERAAELLEASRQAKLAADTARERAEAEARAFQLKLKDVELAEQKAEAKTRQAEWEKRRSRALTMAAVAVALTLGVILFLGRRIDETTEAKNDAETRATNMAATVRELERQAAEAEQRTSVAKLEERTARERTQQAVLDAETSRQQVEKVKAELDQAARSLKQTRAEATQAKFESTLARSEAQKAKDDQAQAHLQAQQASNEAASAARELEYARTNLAQAATELKRMNEQKNGAAATLEKYRVLLKLIGQEPPPASNRPAP